MQRAPCDAPDLVALIHEAVGQIPPGMVSTYGDIASALGDSIAARAVGEVLSGLPNKVDMPKHRVVRSDGKVSDEAGAANLLEAEGVDIADGSVIDLRSRRFTDLHVEPVLSKLQAEQAGVRDRVIGHDDFGELCHVAGLDVSYHGLRGFGAISVHDPWTGEQVEERTIEREVRFPYIPTYLAYRELPVLRPLMTEKAGTIYLVDGHGVLHPRGAGIASHIGVTLNLPTVGAAKSALVGKFLDPVDGRVPLVIGSEVRGYRIGEGSRTTFVSVGHRVSLDTAAEICERLLDRGIPRPLRKAHNAAVRAKRYAV